MPGREKCLHKSLLNSLLIHFFKPKPNQLEHDKELDSVVKSLAVDRKFFRQLLLQLLILRRHIVKGELRQIGRIMVNWSLHLLDIFSVD